MQQLVERGPMLRWLTSSRVLLLSVSVFAFLVTLKQQNTPRGGWPTVARCSRHPSTPHWMPYPPERPFDADLIAAFHTTGTWIDGAFALEQGFIFTAMILSTETIAATLATYA
jgi:hypothetical protein